MYFSLIILSINCYSNVSSSSISYMDGNCCVAVSRNCNVINSYYWSSFNDFEVLSSIGSGMVFITCISYIDCVVVNCQNTNVEYSCTVNDSHIFNDCVINIDSYIACCIIRKCNHNNSLISISYIVHIDVYWSCGFSDFECCCILSREIFVILFKEYGYIVFAHFKIRYIYNYRSVSDFTIIIRSVD